MTHAADPNPSRRFRLLPPDAEVGWIPLAWLVYLAAFLIDPVQRGWDVGYWAVTLAGLLVFLATYFRSHWVQGRELLWLAAVQVALGVGFTPFNLGAAVFFVYASATLARVEPSRRALQLIGLVTLIGIACGLVVDARIFYWSYVVVFTPLIGAVTLHFAQVGRTKTKLQLAHAEIEHLATVAERERIARDLHDVLGHTLSLITLKSELAAKLAERDPARAAREMREVEQVSRSALTEVRETIRGYRATLDDEIARARSLLSAAGVQLEVSVTLSTVDRTRDDVLALVLREMVTNVVRHAAATQCDITIDEDRGASRLVVADDGRGGEIPEGNGLRGMRERIESLGGTITRESSRGTRFTAILPLRHTASTPPGPAGPPQLRVARGGQG